MKQVVDYEWKFLNDYWTNPRTSRPILLEEVCFLDFQACYSHSFSLRPTQCFFRLSTAQTNVSLMHFIKRDIISTESISSHAFHLSFIRNKFITMLHYPLKFIQIHFRHLLSCSVELLGNHFTEYVPTGEYQIERFFLCLLSHLGEIFI